MKIFVTTILLIFTTVIFHSNAHADQALPRLGIDTHSITVSGISSGAFMAVQLGVAYSNIFKGVGAVAGGVYGCSKGNSITAVQTCMKAPEKINSAEFVQNVHSLFNLGLIANPKNIVHQKIFILAGTEDKTVLPEAAQKLGEFYRALGASPVMETSLKMGHAFPSLKGENECAVSAFPWLNNCQYDGAKNILENFYGNLRPVSNEAHEVQSFDQKEFNSQMALMLDSGNIYVPKACNEDGSNCRLHIAIHGCRQNPDLSDAFTTRTGFNEWAESNNIVILYPAAAKSLLNPNSCWDWFGYTGINHAVRGGLQMEAIMGMIRRLSLKHD